MRIEEELKQDKFISEFHKAHLNIIFSSTWLHKKTSDRLKPYKISWQQFNILRILRGMHPQEATVKLLTNRMIDKMSNASRLVEKLRLKGHIERIENSEDRRKVKIFITEKGLEFINEISAVVEQDFQASEWALDEEETKTLNALLDKIRS